MNWTAGTNATCFEAHSQARLTKPNTAALAAQAVVEAKAAPTATNTKSTRRLC